MCAVTNLAAAGRHDFWLVFLHQPVVVIPYPDKINKNQFLQVSGPFITFTCQNSCQEVRQQFRIEAKKFLSGIVELPGSFFKWHLPLSDITRKHRREQIDFARWSETRFTCWSNLWVNWRMRSKGTKGFQFMRLGWTGKKIPAGKVCQDSGMSGCQILQIRSDQIRSDQIRSDQIRSDQID